ncbi:TetR/AcrR family transcriptional regulator [Herpetosiphon sp. NSE202]|uniref:TetR/AcrR family transcriptional regulator n=1 Tax=Herpetosiphon sp. NSE202 TaxID=3351349 RepID=UPI003624BA4B
MADDSKTAKKPTAQRADAQQNHGRILAAAKARFASDGPNAAMDAIARDAGVAVGTLYHHFGSKEGLLNLVIHEHFQVVMDFLAGLQDSAEPWWAVEQVVRGMAKRQLKDRAFKTMIQQHTNLIEASSQAKQGINPAIQSLIDRAKAAGMVRADLQAGDLSGLLAGLPIGDDQAEQRERYLAIVLQGIKSESA